MKKATKFIGIGLGIFIILLILLVIINNLIEIEIKQGLEETLSQNNFTYEKLDVSLLNRKAEVEKPEFELEGKSLSAARISIDDISIFEYLFNKKIEIGELFLKEPNFKLDKSQSHNADKQSEKKDFAEDILIKKINIEKGELTLTENDSAKALIYGKFTQFQLENFQLNKKTINQTPPFSYDAYNFKGDSLFFQMDSRHHLTAGEINIKNGATTVKDIRIIPLYGKKEFQRHIPHELDRFDLKRIKEISFSNIQWEIKNDSLQLRNTLTQINGAHLEIYRDKLQKEDTRQKEMYSQMIRNLPVKIKLDTLRLHNVYIRYEENVAKDRKPGVVDFENLNASIYNLSNIGMNKAGFPQTEIDVQTDFMKEAPVKVNWVFDISNRNDAFKISGTMGLLSATAMNRMLQPAMNVKADGDLDDMAFNYAGNKNIAWGDLSLLYNNFKVEILRKDGTRKNKVFSAIANLIIKNNSKSGNFEHKNLKIERNKTRSFWNYLWLMVREGALKSFI